MRTAITRTSASVASASCVEVHLPPGVGAGCSATQRIGACTRQQRAGRPSAARRGTSEHSDAPRDEFVKLRCATIGHGRRVTWSTWRGRRRRPASADTMLFPFFHAKTAASSVSRCFSLAEADMSRSASACERTQVSPRVDTVGVGPRAHPTQAAQRCLTGSLQPH